MTLTVGSLFSGIGGIDLGLQMTGGFETRWFCEIDPWCRRVLAKHWPNVPCYEDVTTLDFATVERVDVICGGFPCQDISRANHYGSQRAGLSGEHSGLWREMVRAIRVVRPRIVLVENVAALTQRGMDAVLGELAALGYDSETDCIPARAVGAPHLRERIWITAYASDRRYGASQETLRAGRLAPELCAWWCREPAVLRVVDGLPTKLDKHRLRGLGNAVVPQVVEHIGRMILEAA